MPIEIFNQPVSVPMQFLDEFPGNIKLYLKREDLIHPSISGNKWRKLKYNMLMAHEMKVSSIITFGGAFSNHIYATAAAGAACGINTIGVIRGEVVKPLNPTLKKASAWGMELVSVSRKAYKNKTSKEFLASLESKYGQYYLIPEGGSNVLALKGCAEIGSISEKFDYWCLSCGTGGTLAGLVSGVDKQSKVLGFPALKGGRFLQDDISNLLREANINSPVSWELITDYHFGGYAKLPDDLVTFIRKFRSKYEILLDPIYTSKMMFGVLDLIKKGFFPNNSSILALHTGGIQGFTGIEEKYGIKIN